MSTKAKRGGFSLNRRKGSKKSTETADEPAPKGKKSSSSSSVVEDSQMSVADVVVPSDIAETLDALAANVNLQTDTDDKSATADASDKAADDTASKKASKKAPKTASKRKRKSADDTATESKDESAATAPAAKKKKAAKTAAKATEPKTRKTDTEKKSESAKPKESAKKSAARKSTSGDSDTKQSESKETKESDSKATESEEKKDGEKKPRNAVKRIPGTRFRLPKTKTIKDPNAPKRLRKNGKEYKAIRHKAGMVALQQIRYYQRTTDRLICARPFNRLVRDRAYSNATGSSALRFSKPSIILMQEIVEAGTVADMRKANLVTVSRNQVTLTARNIAVQKEICNIEHEIRSGQSGSIIVSDV